MDILWYYTLHFLFVRLVVVDSRREVSLQSGLFFFVNIFWFSLIIIFLILRLLLIL